MAVCVQPAGSCFNTFRASPWKIVTPSPVKNVFIMFQLLQARQRVQNLR
jgi:hypothetical protein